MKALVIGYGVIGKVHCSILSQKGISFDICDNDSAAAEAAAKEYPQSAIYSDWKNAVTSSGAEVVHICTPHYLHADMTVYSLECGSNVICEKPMCIKREDIARIHGAVSKSGKQYGVCQQNRYNGAVLFLKDHVAGKKIAAAYADVVWNRGEQYYRSGEWRGKWATEGGGVLINQAIHTLDILQYIAGIPKELTAIVGNFHLNGIIEVEDTAAVWWKAGDTTVYVHAGTASSVDFPVNIELRVEGKSVRLTPTEVWEDGVCIYRDGVTKVYCKGCYGCGHEGLFDDFYDCVASGRKFALNDDVAEHAVRTVLAAYESNGKSVAL